MILWANGGGTQSTAIAALIVTGKLPKPDLAVIIDTERERSSTWTCLAVVGPALAAVGVTVHRVKKSEYATVDLYGGKDKNTLLMPTFTTQSGETGKLSAYCSNEWKKRVIRRWARGRGVTAGTEWIGYSTDEMNRIGKPNKNWPQRFPLIEQRMNRGDCIALVQRMGWPVTRSSCWMCPNHTQEEWREIKENDPADFRKAVLMDNYIRLKDPHQWLHPDAKPLDECDLSDQNESLFTRCDSGHCFV